MDTLLGETHATHQPVAVYRANGYYRRTNGTRGSWVQFESVAIIVSCNHCEYIRSALSPENAETLVYTHLRSIHPDMIIEQAWSETFGGLLECDLDTSSSVRSVVKKSRRSTTNKS